MVQTYFCRPVRKYRVFTQPSQTLPDQTLSMREILSRFTRGIPMDGKVPIFQDEYSPDPRTLDLTEIQAELDAIKHRANEKMSELEKKKAADAEAKKKEYEDNLIKQALEAHKSLNNPKPTETL